MQKDDATWLRIAYVVFGLIVGYTASKAMTTVGVQTGWGDKYSWFPAVIYISSILSAVLFVFFLAKDQERHKYFLDSIGELRKVTWPSFIDTRRMTIVVCVVVGIFSMILSAFDFVWAKMLGWLLA